MLTVEVSSIFLHEPALPGARSKLKAGMTLVFGGELAVHSVKLVRHPVVGRPGEHKFGVFFPAHTQWVRCPGCNHNCGEHDNFCSVCGVRLAAVPAPDRKHHDYVHPLNHRLRAAVTDAALAAYSRIATPEGLAELDGALGAGRSSGAPDEEFGAGLTG